MKNSIQAHKANTAVPARKTTAAHTAVNNSTAMQAIDRKDIAILKELDFNARASISGIAKKTRLSKEVANYRIKKLIEKGVIKGFAAIVDSFALGYQIYRIQIRFKSINQEKEKELLEWAKNNKTTAWVVDLEGKWDNVLLFWARNPAEFNIEYESFIKRFGHIIQNKLVSIGIEIEHLAHNFLYDRQVQQSIKIGSYNSLKIDETDEKILSLLSKDCRIPLIDLARELGLTANAAKYRIRNLEEKGIIKGYRIILDFKLFGLNHFKIMLYLNDLSRKDKVQEFLRQQKKVIYITKSLGVADLEFEMVAASATEIYPILQELNRLYPGIIADFDEIFTVEERAISYFPR